MKMMKNKGRRGLALFLSLVMCFSLLQLTAFADDEDTTKVLTCTTEEHTHSDDCYKKESVLTCEEEVSEDHTDHTDECYKTLNCEQEETEGHTHDESCYGENGELTCGYHVHDESCYTTSETPVCGYHVHTDECYETVCGELTCELPEHTHGDDCYKQSGEQTVETTDGASITVENLPTGVDVAAQSVTSDLTLTSVNVLAAYDISLTKDGETYNPGETVTVTITLPAGTELPESVQVYHFAGKTDAASITEDDLASALVDGATVDGNTVTFTTSSFSVFAVTAAADETPEETGTTVEVANLDALASAIANVKDGDTIKLTENVTVSSPISLTADKTYTINLGGNTISGDNKTQILKITVGDVTITDGTLTKGYATNGGAISVSGGASLTVGDGCFITESKATNCGGGVCATDNSTVNIDGGTIGGKESDSNTADNAGGGVHASNSTVNIKSGTISYNTAGMNGGGIYVGKTTTSGKSTLNITGGTISHNQGGSKEKLAEFGGGVYANTSTVNFKGGNISENNSNFGGGMCISNGTLEMTDGTISGNTAYYCGGGMYISGSCAAEITTGLIQGNETVEESTWYAYGGGGIYVNQGATLYLENALVTGNIQNSNGIEYGDEYGNVIDTIRAGAGLSACNTSDVRIFLNNGGAIFGNHTGNNNEVSVYKGSSGNTYYTYFSPKMLGGGYYNWSSLDDLSTHGRTTSVEASNDPSSDDQAKAENAATVRIINNTSATTGGGLGVNGSVVFGEASGTTYIVKSQSVNGGTPTTKDLTASAGDTVTYYLTVANETGNSQTVKVTDEVPEGMTLVEENPISDDGSLGEDGKTITWELTVDTLSTKTVSFTVTVEKDGTFSNTAYMGDDHSNTVIINPTAPVVPQPTPDPDPVSLAIPVTKEISGIESTEEAFSFVLTDADGNELGTASISGADMTDGAGDAAFDEIEYTEEGEYVYTVRETIPETVPENWTYDESVYTVTVTVALDEATNQLTADITKLSQDEEDADLETGIVFSNVYTAPSTPDNPGGGGGGSTPYEPSPTPSNPSTPSTPNNPTDIPEPDVPLADVPEPDVPQADVPDADVPQADVPDADVPQADIPEPDMPLTDVPDGDVPLTDVPEPDVPLTDVPVEIPDEDVPQSDVPRTGDNFAIWFVMLLLSGFGLAWLALTGKKRVK